MVVNIRSPAIALPTINRKTHRTLGRPWLPRVVWGLSHRFPFLPLDFQALSLFQYPIERLANSLDVAKVLVTSDVCALPNRFVKALQLAREALGTPR